LGGRFVEHSLHKKTVVEIEQADTAGDDFTPLPNAFTKGDQGPQDLPNKQRASHNGSSWGRLDSLAASPTAFVLQFPLLTVIVEGKVTEKL
jgi:hypothetical protein